MAITCARGRILPAVASLAIATLADVVIVGDRQRPIAMARIYANNHKSASGDVMRGLGDHVTMTIKDHVIFVILCVR